MRKLFSICSIALFAAGCVTPQDPAAHYDLLKTGMSYEEACGAMGSVGHEMTRSSTGGREMVMYRWGSMSGRSVTVMFTDGKLLQKQTMDLRNPGF